MVPRPREVEIEIATGIATETGIAIETKITIATAIRKMAEEDKEISNGSARIKATAPVGGLPSQSRSRPGKKS